MQLIEPEKWSKLISFLIQKKTKFQAAREKKKTWHASVKSENKRGWWPENRNWKREQSASGCRQSSLHSLSHNRLKDLSLFPSGGTFNGWKFLREWVCIECDSLLTAEVVSSSASLARLRLFMLQKQFYLLVMVIIAVQFVKLTKRQHTRQVVGYTINYAASYGELISNQLNKWSMRMLTLFASGGFFL